MDTDQPARCHSGSYTRRMHRENRGGAALGGPLRRLMAPLGILPQADDLAANAAIARSARSARAAPVIRKRTQQDMSDMPVPTGIPTGAGARVGKETGGMADGCPGMFIEGTSVAVVLRPGEVMAIDPKRVPS